MRNIPHLSVGEFPARKRFLEFPAQWHCDCETSRATDLKPATSYPIQAWRENYISLEARPLTSEDGVPQRHFSADAERIGIGLVATSRGAHPLRDLHSAAGQTRAWPAHRRTQEGLPQFPSLLVTSRSIPLAIIREACMKHRKILWKSCAVVLCLCAAYALQREPVMHPRQRALATTAMLGKPALSHAKSPLSFEANQGQTNARVKFLSHGRGYGLFLTGNDAVLRFGGNRPRARVQAPDGRRQLPILRLLSPPNFGFRGPRVELTTKDGGQQAHDSVVCLELVGADPNAAVAGEDKLPGKANYFIGNNPKRWRTNVPTYARVKYRDVYSGVDLVYYGNQG